jgi:hypothetical protein
MAINIISANKNTYGNNGQFETDPSTWGFGSDTYRTIERSSAFYSKGIRSLMAKILQDPVFLFDTPIAVCSPIAIEAGKKYIAKAKVRCNTANPPADDSVVVSVNPFLTFNINNLVVTPALTVGDIKTAANDWFDLQATFDCVTSATMADLAIRLLTSPITGTHLLVDGALYVDEFEVFEYEVVPDAPPPPPDTDYTDIFFSKDPIPLELAQTSNSTEDNYRIYADIKVEDVAGSGIYNSKLITDLEPEADGFCRFNLRQAFVQDVLSAAAPGRNESAIVKLTDRVKLFKVEYGDVFDSMTVPTTLLTSNLFMVMFGGLDKKYFPDIDFFNTYLPENKKFLTWAPISKVINFYQEEYLNFFIHTAAITAMNVLVKCYYDDGTDETYTLFSKVVARGDLYQIPVGPNHTSIGTHNISKNLTKYDVWINDQTATPISEVRTFRLLTEKVASTRFFLFQNSLGSYDTLRCTGLAQVTAEVTKTIRQKHLKMNYETLDGELEASGATFRKQSDNSTGFMTGSFGLAYQQYLLDFLISPKVYDITNGVRVPVVIDSGSMRYKDDDSYQYYLRFKAIESYTNHSFTPDKI